MGNKKRIYNHCNIHSLPDFLIARKKFEVPKIYER